MKTIFSLVLFCLLAISHPSLAQDLALVDSTEHKKSLYDQFKKTEERTFTSHMNFQFCTSLTTSFQDFSLDQARFKLNRLRMEVLGRFFDKFSYHFRYTYNKYTNPNTVDDLTTHVELANMGWDVTDRLTLTAGKQFFMLGGYEYYVNSILVREFSDFNNYTPAYLTGFSATYRLGQNQSLTAEVANNRVETEAEINVGEENISIPKVPLMGAVNWVGKFMNDQALQFYYSAAAGQILKNRNIYYLTFGNVWERGPILAYLDCLYSREEVDSKGLISSIQTVNKESPMTAQYAQYLTWIANIDYRWHPKWNTYVKGTYETGSIYKDNRIYEKGTYRKTWNVQLCVEYYPLKRKDLQIFLHLSHKKTAFTERAEQIGGKDFTTQQIMLGMLYTIPVI